MSQSPPALAWSTDGCTIARAMEILGERWALVVLREIFNGIRRFDLIRAHASVPRQVLSNRLDMLCDRGVLRRHPYREPGDRERYEYRLTDMGFDLYPVLVAVKQWGDAYLADPAGPPVDIVHRDCGAPLAVHLHCTAGHPVHSPRQAQTRPTSSARPWTPA
jgi:DNA-binding HxlR family transcriptional regulator